MVNPETDSQRPAGPGAAQRSPARPSHALRWLPLIMLGGAVGTAVRAGLESQFPPPPSGVPWTTLAINLVGSFVLGLLLETLSEAGADRGALRAARLTLGTGLLGGFTTYSTFVVEVADRLRSGHVALGVGYLVVSVTVGLGAAGLGMLIASRLHLTRQNRSEGTT